MTQANAQSGACRLCAAITRKVVVISTEPKQAATDESVQFRIRWDCKKPMGILGMQLPVTVPNVGSASELTHRDGLFPAGSFGGCRHHGCICSLTKSELNSKEGGAGVTHC